MSDDASRFNNPFGALSGLRDRLPAPTAAPADPAAPEPKKVAGGRTFPRAVVRMERSGRGGKEVTVLEHLTLSAAERGEWLKALKASLGCGGVIEDGAIVLQGDHRKRLPAILTARGVKRVTVSG
jgi:translation initiation factor 1